MKRYIFDYTVFILSAIALVILRGLQNMELISNNGGILLIPFLAGALIICFKYLIIRVIINGMNKRCDELKKK